MLWKRRREALTQRSWLGKADSKLCPKSLGERGQGEELGVEGEGIPGRSNNVLLPNKRT